MTPDLLLTAGDELVGRLWHDPGYSSPGFDVRWRFEATAEFERFRPLFERLWDPRDLDRIRESGLAIKDADGAGYRWISLVIRGPWAYSRGLRPIDPDSRREQERLAGNDQMIERLVADLNQEIVA